MSPSPQPSAGVGRLNSTAVTPECARLFYCAFMFAASFVVEDEARQAELRQKLDYAFGEVDPEGPFKPMMAELKRIAGIGTDTPAAATGHTLDELRARIKPEGPWFDVPASTREFECRSCGAGTYWITTPANRRLLVDCYVNGGNAPTATEKGKGVAHFATCPQGKQWSGKK